MGGYRSPFMTRFLCFLTVLFSAPVCAQAVLSEDALGDVLSRTRSAGLLADSSAAFLVGCAGEGVPVTRSAVVEAVWAEAARRLGGPGPDPFSPMMGFSVDSAATYPAVSWADSLAAVGLLDAGDLAAVRTFVGEYLDSFTDVPLGATVGQFQMIAPLLATRERIDPAWLAADAEQWVAAGLMTRAGRDRLLADARADRLRLPQDALGYLDAFATTDVEVETRWRVDVSGLDSLQRLTQTAADLLRRRGVADLGLSAFAVDSVRRYGYNPYDIDSAYVAESRAPRRAVVLSVRVDGAEYRQEVEPYRPAPLALLNRVLRDRGSVHRLFHAPVPVDGFETARLAVAALTVSQREALGGGRYGDMPPERRRIFETYRDLRERGSPCSQLSLNTFRLAEFDVDLAGPDLSTDETLLTTRRVRQALDGLEGAGLMDHLAPEVRDAVRAGVQERFLREPSEILEAVPDLVVAFDGENAYPPRPYAALLGRFAAVSRGAFAPSDVVDTFSYDADSVDVAFTAGGRRYASRLGVQSDWLDVDVLDLVARATAGGAGRFYRLGPYSEDGYAYLTDAQRRALNRLRLLPVGTVPLREARPD